MHRPLALVLLALLGCAPAAIGPQRTNALEQVSSTLGPDVAAARQAVIDFVEGYATAGQDRGTRLMTVVGTRKLLRWAQWVGVQAEEFRGEIIGQTDLRSLEFLGYLELPDAVGAQLDLDAVVTLTTVPEEGTPGRRTRVFHGPVSTFRRALGDWGVINIFRDGRSMDAQIHLVGEAVTSRHVTVELDSVFTFVPEWSMNLVLSNGSDHTARVRPARAAIVQRGEKPVLGVAGTSNLLSIPDGRSGVQGIITFPALAELGRGDVLEIPVQLDRTEITFRFPLGELISLERPPPTASPSPAG